VTDAHASALAHNAMPVRAALNAVQIAGLATTGGLVG